MLIIEIITIQDLPGRIIIRDLNGFIIDENETRRRIIRRAGDCPSHFCELGLLCVRMEAEKRPNVLQIVVFLKKLLKRLLDIKEGEEFTRNPPQPKQSV